MTLVKRKSGYALIEKVINKTAIISKLSSLAPLVKTISFDKRKEFAEHGKFYAALNSTTYFADPFASRQRGLNKYFNGLLRQYIPRKDGYGP